ncbi:hypothetical protein DM860_014588 [Cuscuta australis]|uniref:Uncharacterized protein n=1 Tax=Cuscuta australis TaxID=267555 RepID=A0A328DKM9_9ASTE|nr:hypothetical protein DM860_014588 [Cuscuta australis]
MLCVRSELNVMNFCFIVGLSLGGLDELHVIDDGFSDIEDTIKGDKVDEFVQRVDFQLSEAKPCAIDGELDLAQVIKCIISHDTVRCATALFQLRMDANLGVAGDEWKVVVVVCRLGLAETEGGGSGFRLRG